MITPTTTSNRVINCSWCGVNLSNASSIFYLNGNLPFCDSCLMGRSRPTKRRKHYTDETLDHLIEEGYVDDSSDEISGR